MTESLLKAGVNSEWLNLEGSHLLECVRVNDLGERTRTWRLVTPNPGAKAALMQRFNRIGARLAGLGLRITDWTWSSRK